MNHGSQWIDSGIGLLPDDMEEVLVYTKTKSIYIGYFSQGDWFESDTSICHSIDVTHWMRLPAPPQACT